jgi:hypothetical protein
MDTNNGWDVCYQAALFELDDTKLRVRINETRHVIDQRLLQASTDCETEERRIANALEVLKVLERSLDRRMGLIRPAA